MGRIWHVANLRIGQTDDGTGNPTTTTISFPLSSFALDIHTHTRTRTHALPRD
jgi:hypothetical protein